MKTFIIRAAIVLFLLTCLFPPWQQTYDSNGTKGGHAAVSVGLQFILTPPAPSRNDSAYGVRLDFTTLFVEWIGCGALLAAPFLLKKLKP